MNRINRLFQDKPRGILSLYFCAGSLHADDAPDIVRTLEKKGVDLVEIGIPFSDPLADGPVIQDAAARALRNGMTLPRLLDELQDIRRDVQIPLILMGYMNPVYRMGYETFFSRCASAGIDGVILPDLPFRDYLNEVKPIADRHDVRVIMLITPETTDERIRFIDENTDGFIYMVSSAAVTGAQQAFDAHKQAYFDHVDRMNLHNPRLIGFGISNRQTLESAQANAAGCIIGSKFVQLLAETGDAATACDRLFEALR